MVVMIDIPCRPHAAEKSLPFDTYLALDADSPLAAPPHRRPRSTLGSLAFRVSRGHPHRAGIRNRLDIRPFNWNTAMSHMNDKVRSRSSPFNEIGHLFHRWFYLGQLV